MCYGKNIIAYMPHEHSQLVYDKGPIYYYNLKIERKNILCVCVCVSQHKRVWESPFSLSLVRKQP